MVLFLHNRYRRTGGEERVVGDLLRLVREQLGEPAELLARDSGELTPAGAALGLLRGGLAPGEVARAVRADGARVLHAHNLQPSFGWRALAAARGPVLGPFCTCTSTASSAPLASASPRGASAPDATGATRCRECG